MQATLIRRHRAKAALIVGFIVVFGFLTIKYVQYRHLQTATTKQYDTVEHLLQDVQSLGGQVILCRNGECRDISTQELVANGQDGYYIVYPKDLALSATAERALLQHQAEELKRLTQRGENL